MGSPKDVGAFRRRIARIEALIQAIEQSADPAVRADAQELIQAVLDLHGAGLARGLELVAEAGEAGRAAIDAMGRDDLVGSVLLLHGLHPLDLETRVQAALEKVRPYLKSHGGDVVLVGVADGVVRLRMQGSCNGCPSSAMTLKHSIEEAITEAAPDAVAIEVEGAVETPPPGFIPIASILGGAGAMPPKRDEPATIGVPR